MKKKLITFALLVCTFGTMLFPGFSPRQTIAYAAENAGRLNKKDVDIVKNQQFTLKILGGKKSDSVVFQVRDNDIVSITASNKKNRTCKIKGISVGSTKVLANVYRNDRKLCTLKCNVTVTPPAVSVRFRTSSITMDIGDSLNLMHYLNLKPKNTAEKPVFSCSDTSIVRVKRNGRTEALKEGSVIVTASILNQKYDTIVIKVLD